MTVRRKYRYKMRCDWVLLRKEVQSKVGSVLVPERSKEGTNFFVEGVGPDVKDGLKVGDQVMIMGMANDPFYPVPGESDLIMITQKQVAYVLEKNEE